MVVRIVLGSIVAGVVMMVFGFVFWALSPMPERMLKPVPNAERVAATLRDNIPDEGVYFLPYPIAPDASEAATADYTERHERGPIFRLFYHPGGAPAMSPLTYAMGLAHFCLSAVLAAALLALAAPVLSSYASRVVFVTLLGLFAAFSLNLAGPIWFFDPWPYWIMMVGYDTIRWLLAGLALAAFVKRPADAAPRLQPA